MELGTRADVLKKFIKKNARDYLIVMSCIYFAWCGIVLGDCVGLSFTGALRGYTFKLLAIFFLATVFFACMVKYEKAGRLYKPFLAAVMILGQLVIIWTGAWMLEMPLGHQVNLNEKIYRMEYMALLVIIWLLVFLLTNHTKAANIIYILLLCIYGQADAFVNNVRGVPIQPQDYASLSAAKNVASAYKFTLTHDMSHQLKVTVLLMAFIVLLRDYRIPGKAVRLSIMGAYAVLMSVLVVFFVRSASVCDKLKLTVNTFDIIQYYRDQGYLPSFLVDIRRLIIDKPEGYSREEAEALLGSLSGEEAGSGEMPDIVVIMNESFSDLSVINDFETNTDYMPYWYTLTENTVRGNMYVSAKGGQTVNTEFEFLTGNSVAFLSNTGYTYIEKKTESLVSTLQAQGYKTVGFHPFNSSGYRRGTIYNRFLCFDESYFIEDINADECTYPRGNSFMSDESDYEKVREMYEAAGDSPVFIFNVTMQNHGGYRTGLADVQVQGIDVPMTNEYLSLVLKSNEALENLIEYFENQDRKTIVVVFGDHQPAVEDEFFEYLYGKDLESLTLDEVQKGYEVPFLIWANYDIDEEENVVISSNYLSSYLLKIAGLRMTSYNRYLLGLHESVPAININGYMGSDGVFYSFDDESEYTDMVNEYNEIEYYNMFDSERKSIYFQVSQ